MNNKKLVIICSSFIIVSILFIFLVLNNNKKTFFLENKYYGLKSINEIKIDELNKLIDNKESFAVFIYQPMCITSSDFEEVLNSFLEENQISIYKIAYSDIKDTDIGKSVKYYPSFIIYNKGEMVDFLESNKDEDVNYYSSKEGFSKWFTKYVDLKNTSSSNLDTDETFSKSEENNITIDTNLENVTREDNKVNIYFFWGNGCSHCEEEFEFFESIKEKYGKHYNLYTFETWYDEKNANLLYTFAENMGDRVTGVPYTIIGDESFVGFGETYEKYFVNAIENQHNNSYDVYFDKIKK